MSLVTVLSACSTIGTSKSAALQVTSQPEASLFLDGKFLGKTPYFSDQLRVGEHTLKVAAEETEYVDQITLNAQTLTVVNRQLADNFLAQSGEILTLESAAKGFFVITMPPEADLTIDGKSFGKTPILTNLDEGEHKIRLEKSGYLARELAVKTSSKYQLVADVTLASQLARDINIVPSPPPTVKVEIGPTPAGFLRIRSEPSLSSAEIGRVKTGEQFTVLQEVADWIKITFEGKQGWVSSQYTIKL